MFTASSACLTLIKTYEGVRRSAYPDPATGAEPITIGVGHTQPGLKLGTVWTMAQVDAALASDVAKFARSLNALLGSARTTQHQFDAMVSLMFNIGPANFAKSSVLANHIHGRPTNAAAAFVLWNKAAGKVMAGLTNRRQAEAALYLS